MARILNEKQAAEFFSILGDPPKFTSEVFIDLFAWRKKSNGIRFYVDDIIIRWLQPFSKLVRLFVRFCFPIL